MAEPIVLLISPGEEYDRLFALVREQTNLRKCRSWFDRTAVIGDVRVEITSTGIGITYETATGTVSDHCVYSAVSALTELKTGVVLRLSHGRMLFLPTGSDKEYLLMLMDALERMEQKIANRFQDCPISLPEIGMLRRLQFRHRPRRGLAFSHHRVTGSFRYWIIGIICAGVLMGTMMVTQPLRSQRIRPEEARIVRGTFLQAEGVWFRSGLQRIDLLLGNGQKESVRECNSALLETFEEIPAEMELTLWIHPGDAGVLQIEAQGALLLEFENAMDSAWTNALMLAGFGVAIYAGCAYIWYDVFFKKRKR